MSDLKDILFSDDSKVILKEDVEKEKRKSLITVEGEYSLVCTQCSFKTNSFTRYTQHIHDTHHKVKDVNGVIGF